MMLSRLLMLLPAVAAATGDAATDAYASSLVSPPPLHRSQVRINEDTGAVLVVTGQFPEGELATEHSALERTVEACPMRRRP